MDIDKINQSLNGLAEQALTFVPNDPVLPYLAAIMPRPVTKENAKTAVIVLSLLCRRLATVFTDLAVEQEKLIEQWQNSQR